MREQIKIKLPKKLLSIDASIIIVESGHRDIIIEIVDECDSYKVINQIESP